MKKIKFIFIFLTLALVFFNVYYPHLNYPFPMHVDEWQHIAQSIQIIDKGLVNENPYFHGIEHKDFEPGFHIFLAQFFSLTGLNPILNYRFLPAIFAVLAALILFIFLYKITNFWVALLSIIFFSILPSNVNILGTIFFVPLTLSILLLYSFFLFFKTNKKIIALIILLILFFIHPPSALILIPFIFFNYLTKPNTRKKIKEFVKKYKLFLIPISILFLFLVFFFKDFLLKIVTTFIFGNLKMVESRNFIIRYPLSSLYGNINTILAVFGGFFAFFGGFVGLKNKLRDFVLWLLFILSVFFLSIFFESIAHFSYPLGIFDFLYRKLLYYIMIGFVPLSAIGFYSILKLFSKLKINKNLIKVFSIITAFFLLFFVFYEFTKIYQHSNIDSPSTKIYYLINKEEYEAIRWLLNFPPGIVMAPLRISSAIYPISKHKVVGIIEGQLGGGSEYDTTLFFMGDNCTVKERIIKKHNVDFVFSKEKINCKNLEEIYIKNNYIYKVT